VTAGRQARPLPEATARQPAPRPHVRDGSGEPGKVGYVFVSYARTDRTYVEDLARHLADAGITMWYDYEIATGERFAAVIEQKIRDCAAFVVVLTPEAVASEWVYREISFATTRRKPVLPIVLRSCELPILVHDLQHEDLTTGHYPVSPAFMRRLESHLRG
jgi:hypothetical protein